MANKTPGVTLIQTAWNSKGIPNKFIFKKNQKKSQLHAKSWKYILYIALMKTVYFLYSPYENGIFCIEPIWKRYILYIAHMKTVRTTWAQTGPVFARDYTTAWTITQHAVKPTVLAWVFIYFHFLCMRAVRGSGETAQMRRLRRQSLSLIASVWLICMF